MRCAHAALDQADEQADFVLRTTVVRGVKRPYTVSCVSLKVPAQDTRNPFSGKGLAVTVALLEDPARAWTIADLAERAEASRELTTKVMRRLHALRLVTGDFSQGRRAIVSPRQQLIEAAARAWPDAAVFVAGGRPPLALPAGGDAAGAALGVVWEARPRRYVRTKADLPRVLAQAGGHLVTEPVGEWEICIVDFPFAPGPLPPLVAAVELASAPRGREVIRPHLQRLWRAATSG